MSDSSKRKFWKVLSVSLLYEDKKALHKSFFGNLDIAVKFFEKSTILILMVTFKIFVHILGKRFIEKIYFLKYYIFVSDRRVFKK